MPLSIFSIYSSDNQSPLKNSTMMGKRERRKQGREGEKEKKGREISWGEISLLQYSSKEHSGRPLESP